MLEEVAIANTTGGSPASTMTQESFVAQLMAGDAGAFLRLRPLRRLIAQEVAIDEVRPFVETSDLLEFEPGLLENWRHERPEIAESAEKLARERLIQFDLSGNSGEHTDRLLLRMSALRRLDSWHTGQDQNSVWPCSFAGAVNIQIHLPESDRPIKVGTPTVSFYGSDPRLDQELLALYNNEALVQELEYALFPLAGRGGLIDVKHWIEIRSRWREAKPLRDLETFTRRGAFPSGLFFERPPDDIVARIEPDFIASLDQMVFTSFGLCPWWPKATAQYFSDRQILYPALADEAMLRWWCQRLWLRRIAN